MAIISRVGRKALKTRLLLYSIFTVLCIGAVSMIYPFMLMVSGTTKSAVDTPDADAIPKYLTDSNELYKKDVEAYFNESLDLAKQIFNIESFSFRDVVPPEKPNAKFANEWTEYIKGNRFPYYFSELSSVHTPNTRGTMALNLRKFKELMSKKSGGDLEKLNNTLGTDFANWNNFIVTPEVYLQRSIVVQANPGQFRWEYRNFRLSLPVSESFFISVPGFYKYAFLKVVYFNSLEAYNDTHRTAYKSWNQIALSPRFPAGAGAKEQEDWLNFVRGFVNPVWIRADEAAKPQFSEYLKAKYGKIENLNRIYSCSYGDFREIPLFNGNVENDMAVSDYFAFVQGWNEPSNGKLHQLPEKYISIDCIDFRFAEHLESKYGNLENLNSKCGTSFTSWDAIIPPQRDTYFISFSKNKFQKRWEFTARNFIAVSNYLFLHGKALLNTFIYCSLSIVMALIFNPIAAYALSRYKPPSTYKILLFLMLTMAFPPMVTQIPVFLLLRKFHLLNSYWALVLPGLANGYAIFMLKGFFDSLPQELYESASIDGAGEIRIFWQITMSLSTPILAVIGLNAFIGSYSNFMMALLICQDQNMWTIMPWLYQLQANSSQGVIFAALVIAAIPTLLVYSLCQNVIMRGIVVPVEK